ncbi:MAG TPA: hypothetical protein VNI01_13110, partial [Elusimicrobiota bacterium]|nr:hypothetical protein [Elusimicrobiota bacterium]
MKLSIDAKQAEDRLAEARRQVSASGLPALLGRIDPGAFGTTPLNLQAADAVAGGLSVGLAAAARADGLPPLYLGLVLAEEAGDRLQSVGGSKERDPEDRSLPEAQYRDLSSSSPADLFAAMLGDCRDFLAFYQGHADSSKRVTRDGEAARCLRSYFRLIANTLRKLLPPTVDAQVDTPRLRFAGTRSSVLAVDEPPELLPVGFDDIVGNEEMVKAGRRLARDVAGFDVAAGVNPKKVRNQVLFALGSPGCGKTVTAHAILRYFLDLCSKAEMPAKVRVIRRTDWASSYQNQSASRLLEIFRDEVFNAPGVCGVYWPDIDTAFAA